MRLLIIPNMGIIVPNMGEKNPSTGLGDVLFSKTRRKVFQLLFGHPDRAFHMNEIVRFAEAGTGSVDRELKKLVASGVLTVEPVGNQRRYQANLKSPIYQELRGIVQKTFGLKDVLFDALASLPGTLECALVYGSVAKGTDSAESDIDLMVVADNLAYGELMAALVDAEKILGRRINPTLYSRREFVAKRDEGNTFLSRVLEQPTLPIMDNEACNEPNGKPREDGPFEG
ncbi:MAG: nucleotidyltransferase domain-containing protein [Gammaproteobacteria bacterium]